MTGLDLDTRQGWPADLHVLFEKYPREVWPGHANLGETARFWLARHDMFRELGGILQGSTREFREDRLAPDAFRAFFVPRLQVFLGELEGHHQIEDHHFFPLFRRAETRLLKGFDVLERDHEVIHGEILRVVETANSLLHELQNATGDRAAATIHYAGASDRLLRSLLRHLEDEEDLIMPVILDRSEPVLFAGTALSD